MSNINISNYIFVNHWFLLYTKQTSVSAAHGLFSQRAPRHEHINPAGGQLAHANRGCAARAEAMQYPPTAFSVHYLLCIRIVLPSVLSNKHNTEVYKRSSDMLNKAHHMQKGLDRDAPSDI